MQQEKHLEKFQSALLELFNKPLSAKEILHQLQTDPAFLPYQDYISTFDLKMVDTASFLVKKWVS